MMNWKKKLEVLEDEKKWLSAIELMKLTIDDSPNDVEAYIRIIYLLHHIVVEEDLVELQIDTYTITDLLTKYFKDSKNKFSDNAQYLFFIGQILFIADWYFGVDEDFIPLEETLAFKMQKRAYEIEPNNILFKWACYYSSKNKLADYLANTILNDEGVISSLKSKGFPGEYILNSLERGRQRYNDTDASVFLK